MTFFPCFVLYAKNKWKRRPSAGGDMTEYFPRITLLGIPIIRKYGDPSISKL